MAVDKFLSTAMSRLPDQVGYNKGETAEGVFHFFNGMLHRENAPAIEYKNGLKEWWIGGERHRADGPAIEGSNGRKEWWLNGKLHREDGPAIEYKNGHKEWWANGVELTESEFNSAVFAKNLGSELADKPAIRKVKI